MKLAIQGSLRQRASLLEEDLRQLGFRGIEVPAHSLETESAQGLKPCILDSFEALEETGSHLEQSVWAQWFEAARLGGAQGVSAAVVQGDDLKMVREHVLRLSEIAWETGSTLLLTVRTEAQSQAQAAYAPLIEWCRQRDGRGLGLILDVEAAVESGESPRRLLREAEGYVQHVRVPSPSWRTVPEPVIVEVLRELQRISYIDYIALYGSPTIDQLGTEAIEALRRAVVKAWS